MPREPGHYRFLLAQGVRHLVSLSERAPPHHGCCPAIRLHRLCVPDFTPPTPEQIQSFLQLVEEANARGEVRRGARHTGVTLRGVALQGGGGGTQGEVTPMGNTMGATAVRPRGDAEEHGAGWVGCSGDTPIPPCRCQLTVRRCRPGCGGALHAGTRPDRHHAGLLPGEGAEDEWRRCHPGGPAAAARLHRDAGAGASRGPVLPAGLVGAAPQWGVLSLCH